MQAAASDVHGCPGRSGTLHPADSLAHPPAARCAGQGSGLTPVRSQTRCPAPPRYASSTVQCGRWRAAVGSGGGNQSGTTGAQRVAQRDSTAVGVGARVLVSQAPSSCRSAKPCAMKASLRSIPSVCASDGPVSANTLRVTGAGAMRMMRGATPAMAMPTMRARGVRPGRPASCSFASPKTQDHLWRLRRCPP